MSDPGKTADELSDTTAAWITEVVTRACRRFDDSNDTEEDDD